MTVANFPGPGLTAEQWSQVTALATSLNQRTTEAISSGNAKAALDAMQSDLEKVAKGS